MLNVNQITSQLAKMPDNALQQYATMHKADPYMLALTIAESNRRKEMRTAAQGAQGALPQPKVADQAIAGMSPQQLPENVGIGALPADNMKGMAGGGIVAFEVGGHVPGYAGNTDGSLVYDPVTGMPLAGSAEPTGPEVEGGTTFWERLGLGNPANRKVLEQVERDAAARKAAAKAPDTTKKVDTATAAVDTKTTPVPEIKKGLGATAAGQQSGLSGGAGGAGTYKPSTLADMMKEVSPEVEKMNAEDRKAMDPFRTQFEEERASLAKRKETNKGEALLAAGLGMMAGNSRHALQNIGTGAQQGLASLKDATRADDAAKRALMQSEMHLAQAEMQGRKGNFQSMNQLANQARQEKQFAVSSELQRQQIANQGAYYVSMAKAAEAKGSMDSKMMSEWGRLQKLAEQHVKDNGGMTMTDAQRSAMYQDKLNELTATNPFLSKLGGQQAAAPTAVRLAGQSYGE